eukprot:3742132-Pleurochrysis_carterae.AAC.1
MAKQIMCFNSLNKVACLLLKINKLKNYEPRLTIACARAHASAKRTLARLRFSLNRGDAKLLPETSNRHELRFASCSFYEATSCFKFQMWTVLITL